MPLSVDTAKDLRIDIDGGKPFSEKGKKMKRPMKGWKSFPNSPYTPRSRKWMKNMYSDILQIDGNSLPTLPEDEEAVGIITMEDVIEELLQVQFITSLET